METMSKFIRMQNCAELPADVRLFASLTPIDTRHSEHGGGRDADLSTRPGDQGRDRATK